MNVLALDWAARQSGKSAIGNVVVLALIAYGVWIGIQFVPQRIEAGTVRTMLDKVEQRHYATPYQGDQDLWNTINKHLNVNEMNDMKSNIKVTWDRNVATVRVSYERDLNLIFTTKKMKFNETVVLN
ncbi:MAG: DUF4845 domain-containing protein [Xanthomonadales bacterium]|nr:DUF4845 domain-containing protein [Xanthomonadales bacterium]